MQVSWLYLLYCEIKLLYGSKSHLLEIIVWNNAKFFSVRFKELVISIFFIFKGRKKNTKELEPRTINKKGLTLQNGHIFYHRQCRLHNFCNKFIIFKKNTQLTKWHCVELKMQVKRQFLKVSS